MSDVLFMRTSCEQVAKLLCTCGAKRVKRAKRLRELNELKGIAITRDAKRAKQLRELNELSGINKSINSPIIENKKEKKVRKIKINLDKSTSTKSRKSKIK